MHRSFELENISITLPRGHHLRRRLWREWCFVRVVGRQFVVRMGLIAAVVGAGAGLFMWLEPERQHGFARAAYITWALVFGESPEEFPRSRVLQALFFLMPIVGLTVIIEGIVEFSLTLRDRRRNEKGWCMVMAQAMNNHIVLVGLGRLGYRTFRLLRRMGHAVVIIEKDVASPFLEEVRRDGSPLLLADARNDPVLVDANVASARSIILATDDDLANLEIALDARRLNPAVRVVMRMFDQNMADKIRDGFNIHLAMSQSAISAPAFATAAIEPTIVGSFVLDDELIVMQRHRVEPDGPFVGRSVSDVQSVTQCAIVSHRPLNGGRALFPRSDARFSTGDEIVLQGRYEVLAKLCGTTESMGSG